MPAFNKDDRVRLIDEHAQFNAHHGGKVTSVTNDFIYVLMDGDSRSIAIFPWRLEPELSKKAENFRIFSTTFGEGSWLYDASRNNREDALLKATLLLQDNPDRKYIVVQDVAESFKETIEVPVVHTEIKTVYKMKEV